MEYIRLYFPDADQHSEWPDTGLVSLFHRSIMEKLEEKEVSLQEIETGLCVSTEYLEEKLGTLVLTREGIDHLRCALTKILAEKKNVLVKTYVKIFPFSEPVPFTLLRHSMVGKLFSVAGVVAHIESSKPVAEKVPFECRKCRSLVLQQLSVPGVYEKPKECVKGCRSKAFAHLEDSPLAVFSDIQRIRLHEVCLGEKEEGPERKPGVLGCTLSAPFVNTLLPGDAVHALGFGVAEEAEMHTYSLSMEVSNLYFLKQRETGLQEAPGFAPNEIQEIKELAEKDNVLGALSSVLFPDILGHPRTKEGILLSLVGGSGKKNGTRKELHLLMVGDPGIGKSKMLRGISTLLPRSNYLCGTTCSAGGLGVSLHSKSGGEYELEAGALVLSDLGQCFIDELDKLETPQTLFEAMEMQQISIAKAGIVCTMPTRCTILAASNPVFGRYDRSKSVEANVGFSDAFLARFDIIFLLLDENLDTCEFLEEVSSRLLDMKTQTGVSGAEGSPDVSADAARKYLQYARDQVHPVLSASAKEMLVEVYGALRRKGEYNGRTTICAPSPRLVGSLIRVAEARAKIDLRAVCTRADVEFAVGICTVPGSFRATDVKKRSPLDKLLELIRREASGEDNGQPEGTITHKAAVALGESLGLTREKSEALVSSLNTAGLLMKKSGSMYRVKGPAPS